MKKNSSSPFPPNLQRHDLGLLRAVVHNAFLVFSLFVGYRFYLFYLWAMHRSSTFVPRPPSVEGFLPISALLGLKRLLLTGVYDPVHPAGLTILLAAIVIGLLLRKGFCGWICPVGAFSHLVENLGRRFHMQIRLPIWLDLPLLSVKYLLLAFFLYAIFWKMNLRALIGFQNSPYNHGADARMLQFFLHPSVLAGSILFFLSIISLPLANFWCRYLCPYGGLLGLLALCSPIRIRRDAEKCIDCKKCRKICPASIKVDTKTTVVAPECIGCLECVAICPKDECLTVTAGPRKRLPVFFLPALVLLLYFSFYLGANLTGNWHSQLSPTDFQRAYTISKSLQHP